MRDRNLGESDASGYVGRKFLVLGESIAVHERDRDAVDAVGLCGNERHF